MADFSGNNIALLSWQFLNFWEKLPEKFILRVKPVVYFRIRSVKTNYDKWNEEQKDDRSDISKIDFFQDLLKAQACSSAKNWDQKQKKSGLIGFKIYNAYLQ